jgi:hypothetical protein
MGCLTKAVERLTDQALLADIARTDHRDARWKAVERLTDQTLLADLARTGSDSSVRLEAAKKLIDETLLADLAKTGSDGDVRQEAVKKLTDQALLADIARTDSYVKARLWAVHTLTDDQQPILADIARMDSDSSVRWVAVRRLTDQALLAVIARKDGDSSVREMAVKSLTDQALLADIARTDSDGKVRVVAAERIMKLCGQTGHTWRHGKCARCGVIRRHYCEFTDLHMAITPSADLSAIRDLCRNGLVNVGDEEGFTPLMKASGSEGSLAIVEVLIEFGANVNAESKKGTSALSMAALHDKQDVVQYLRAHGAKGGFAVRRISSDGESRTPY